MTYKLLYGQPESAIEWTGNFDAYFVALDTWGKARTSEYGTRNES